jgi:hypothetical protein
MMIDSKMHLRAMRALHEALAALRTKELLAGDASTASILDDLEILPKYLVEPTDRTDMIRLLIEDVARKLESPYILAGYLGERTTEW